MKSTKCPCQTPGPCPHYNGKQIVGRLWELCQDTTELGEKYRRLWAEQAGKVATSEDLPGILTQAANLAQATAQHVAAGLPQADKATVEYRLNQCNNCERCVKGASPEEKNEWRCAECGCYVLTKAGWAEQKCPLGKWELPVVSAVPPPQKKAGGCGCSAKK